MSSEKIRLDKYLWAIRIFKTRTQAAKACEEGKVKLNGRAAKAAHVVIIDEQYDIKTSARKWTIKITGFLQNRMSYEDAIKNYIDITSEEDKKMNQHISASFYTGKRLSKTGRPTKKQRRDLNDFMSEDEDA